MVSNEVRQNLMFILSAIADQNRGDVQLIWNADAIDIVRNLIDDAFNGLTLNTISTGVFKPAIGKTLEIPEAKGTLDWIGLNPPSGKKGT